jgi:hypothetical protein
MSLKQDDVVTASTYILIKKAAWFERMAVHFCATGVVDHNATLWHSIYVPCAMTEHLCLAQMLCTRTTISETVMMFDVPFCLFFKRTGSQHHSLLTFVIVHPVEVMIMH